MAEEQSSEFPKSPEIEDQSEDDIDRLFKEELTRMSQEHSTSQTDPGSLVQSPDGLESDVHLNGSSDDPVGGRLVLRDGDPGSRSLLGSFWDWSTSTYRWTRQLFVEGLGYGSHTVDLQLRSEIITLYQLRRQYKGICSIVTKLAANFEQVLATQQELGNAFRLMSIQDEYLTKEYQCNTELQSILHRNGCSLLATMKSFVSGIHTLCNQTMVDTLWTSKQLNYARIQYDALKSEFDAFRSKNSDCQKLRDLERNLEEQREKYENLKENLQVKLKLLHEHRISVMHQRLESFQTAMKDYFAGNSVPELDDILHSTRASLTSADLSSWLEQK